MGVMDKGGPAFPTDDASIDAAGNRKPFHSGMSLRDYFAGHASVGLIANPNNRGTPAEVAKISYQVADAMLAERSK